MTYPVCVVCPECTAIYTPDVEGINAQVATDLNRYRDERDEALSRVAAMHEALNLIRQLKTFIPYDKPEQDPLPEWIGDLRRRVDEALAASGQANG